ncbi:MAG: hypothetical protein WEA58_04655 [Balneolaceae bacterium]
MKEPEDQIRELKQIAQLSDTDNFIAEFHHQQTIHSTYTEAYEAVEAMYQKLFPAPKYSSYKSFEFVYRRKMKSRKSTNERN